MAWKKTLTLGRQTIPNFARELTVCEGARCLTKGDGTQLMPEVSTLYNIACVVFLRRGGIKQIAVAANDVIYAAAQPLGVTYWAQDTSSGAVHRYGLDKVPIPGGAEWVSIGWFAPPDGTQGNAPDPASFPPAEDFFRFRWGLSI